jgi:hypothetical protein
MVRVCRGGLIQIAGANRIVVKAVVEWYPTAVIVDRTKPGGGMRKDQLSRSSTALERVG